MVNRMPGTWLTPCSSSPMQRVCREKIHNTNLDPQRRGQFSGFPLLNVIECFLAQERNLLAASPIITGREERRLTKHRDKLFRCREK